MDEDHKAALAAGREESRAVDAYLEARVIHAPKRGRRRTEETVRTQLAEADFQLGGNDLSMVQRLALTQKRMDLEAELRHMTMAGENNLEELETEFIIHAGSYAKRKGISYAAFRELGVPADVLKKAGISRAGG